MRKKKIHITITAALLAIVLLAGGCRKKPEQSIVVNKDFDNMIEEAENTEDMQEVSDLAKDYETYQIILSDESLQITAKIDAQVDIPQTEQLSVLRVRQKDITQEMLDTLIKNTVQNQTLYDGSELYKRTKRMIEADIAYYQGELKNDNLFFESEEQRAAYMAECQGKIDALQVEYEAARDTVTVGEYKSDCKLRDIDELVSMYPSEFYDWEKPLNPDGQVFFGVSDGKDGNYISIYAQNNDNYGNCIRYWKSDSSWMWNASVVANTAIRWESDADIPDYFDRSTPFVEIEEGKTTISLEEAKNAADKFLADMEIEDFVCEDGRLYNVYMSDGMRYSDEHLSDHVYKKMYAFKYLREIDGVFVSDQESKLVDGMQGDTYVKMNWGSEYIMIYVDDSGVVRFDYESPIEITDTIVEKAKVKSFADIKPVFEQMVLISQAEDDVNIEVQIDRVELVYARISEANSFDTGLIVPVWNFNGTVIAEGSIQVNGEGSSNVLSINAIDNSIIDWELGY
ncbi:MAG: hypothetical protein K2G45_11100 [Lachnospiraceae bacterium]|nr:hypothetical protein [Lachnospiraceae bacterium]